jgi:phage FluMu gp28-like protein
MLAIMFAGGVAHKGKVIPPHDVHIISETYNKAMHVIKEIRKLVDEMDIIEKVSHNVLGGKTEVVFKNGQTITAHAGRVGCLQGYTGTVMWDEVSLSQSDHEEMMQQALATSSAKDYYRVILATNADKYGSWVWNMWHSTDEEWKRRGKLLKKHPVSIYDAYPNGIPNHILERKAMMSDRGWRRWYLNEFLTGDDNRFDLESIHQASKHEWNCNNGLRILSIDPGWSTTGDPSGVVVVAATGGRVEVLHSDLWFGMPEADQRAKIRELMVKHRCSRIIIDQGVGGLVMTQALKREYGDHCVYPVSFNKNKYALWSMELDKLLSEGNLKIPKHNRYLIEDLSSIEVDSKGNIHLPRVSHSVGKSMRHCDSAAALMPIVEHIGGRGALLSGPEIVEVDERYHADDFSNTVFGFDDNLDRFL